MQGRSGEDSPIHLADRTDGVNCEREKRRRRMMESNESPEIPDRRRGRGRGGGGGGHQKSPVFLRAATDGGRSNDNSDGNSPQGPGQDRKHPSHGWLGR